MLPNSNVGAVLQSNIYSTHINMYIMGKNGEGKGESIPQVCVVNYLFSLSTNLQLNHTIYQC